MIRMITKKASLSDKRHFSEQITFEEKVFSVIEMLDETTSFFSSTSKGEKIPLCT